MAKTISIYDRLGNVLHRGKDLAVVIRHARANPCEVVRIDTAVNPNHSNQYAVTFYFDPESSDPTHALTHWGDWRVLLDWLAARRNWVHIHRIRFSDQATFDLFLASDYGQHKAFKGVQFAGPAGNQFTRQQPITNTTNERNYPLTNTPADQQQTRTGTGYIVNFPGKGSYSTEGRITPTPTDEQVNTHNHKLNSMELNAWCYQPDEYLAYYTDEGYITTFLGTLLGRAYSMDTLKLPYGDATALKVQGTNGAYYHARANTGHTLVKLFKYKRTPKLTQADMIQLDRMRKLEQANVVKLKPTKPARS